MKAFVVERYGSPDVLRLCELARPEPRANEVLIRVRATTVTSADCRIRAMNMPRGFGLLARLALGVIRPRQAILGTELAGDVVAVGQAVSRFRVGDAVFGMSGVTMGCHAEYRCLPESAALAIKPRHLSYEDAAALPFGGITALDFFRRGKFRPGERALINGTNGGVARLWHRAGDGRAERVLVNGASGAVGTAAIQLARHFGAEVTAVCSAANRELVLSLGASHAIDYAREDFTRNGQRYDVIVDTVGTAPFTRSQASLARDGRLLLVLAGLPDMLPIPWVELTSARKIVVGPAAERAEDVRHLADLVRSGEYRPVVDRRYSFEQLPEAHRHVDTGRKRGSVVVTL